MDQKAPGTLRPGGRTARTRAAVLEAVTGELIEHGYAGASVERVAARASDGGAQVEQRLPDVDWSQQRIFGELLSAVTGVFDPAAQLSPEQRSLAWYLTALDQRDRFSAGWHAFFDSGYDALIVPPAASTAFPHDIRDSRDQGPLLAFANLAGLPALAVPAGRDENGLPIGVQIVGPRWSEMRLLEVAAALEAAHILPGFHRPPGC